MYVDTIKSRLRAFVSHLGIDSVAFQNSIGASSGYMSRDSEPNGAIIANVLRTYPQLSPDWLLTGEGSMLRSMHDHPSVVHIDAKPELAEPTQPYKAEKKPDTITIPMAVWDQLRQQLENKDAQIATLLTKIQ